MIERKAFSRPFRSSLLKDALAPDINFRLALAFAVISAPVAEAAGALGRPSQGESPGIRSELRTIASRQCISPDWRKMRTITFHQELCLVFCKNALYSRVSFILEHQLVGGKMITTITARGQTVVPARIRKAHHLDRECKIEWIDDGLSIRVVPLGSDTIRRARGLFGKGTLRKALIEARREDRSLE